MKIRFAFTLLFCAGGSLSSTAQNADSAQPLPLQEVVVRAYEQSRSLRQMPAAVNFVGRNALERFNPFSLVQAVNSTPGVRMEERSPGSYRFNIRGSSLRSPFGVRNVKVYFNDIPYTQPGGTSYINQLGFYNIQSVEIIKGPASSLYGAGTGGVLLIESLNEAAAAGLEADYTFGAYAHHSAHAALTTKTGNNTNRFSFQHQQSNGYRQQSALQRDVAAWTGRYAPNAATIVKVSFLASDLFYETPGALTAAEFKLAPATARPAGAFPSAVAAKAAIYQQTFVAGASLQQAISQNISAKTVLYGAYTRLRNPNIRGYDQSSEPHTGGRIVFTYKPQTEKTNITLQAGAEAQIGWTGISSAENAAGRPDSLRYTDDVENRQATYFVQAQWEKGPWQLMAGGSINDLNISFQRFTPQTTGLQVQHFKNKAAGRLALMRNWKTLSAYASISEGFSPPAISELLPTGSAINTGLLPEAGTNYDLGARATFGKLRADINLFYFRLKNTIVQRRDLAGGDYYINSGKTAQKGLEAAFQYNIWQAQKGTALLWASYTHHAFRYRNFTQLNDDFSGNRLPGISPNVLAAGTDVRWQQWTVHLTYQYNDVMPLNDANTAKAAVSHIMNVQVKWQPPGNNKFGWQILAGAENLLNQRYSLGYDINAAGGRYYNAAPVRSYFAGFSLNLKKPL